MKQSMTRVIALVAVAGLAACGGGDDSKAEEAENAAANGEANNVAANNTEVNNATVNNGTPNGLTYYQDVKPIIDANCVACHGQNGIGPFPLTTFEEVSGVKALVQSAVQNQLMPPFIYSNECRDYTHDPTLSQEQIDTIVTWVDDGGLEGDPEKEAPPIEVETPEPPEFDTTLAMPQEYTPKQSPDDYRCFVVDWPHDTQKFVTGFGVEPGNDEIVHHVIGFLAPPNMVDTVEQMDADEDEPGDGYTCFGGPGFDDTQWIGSWAPGGQPARYPGDTGLAVEPGSKMVIQVHYNTLTVEPAPDLTKIKVQTADTVADQALFLPWANPQWLQGSGMHIAAGDADASAQFAYDPTGFLNGQSIKIWGGGLHMHLLGTSARAWIDRADGEDECLVETPRWDFDWQTGVDFAEPTVLNPGDQLAIECHWDNSMQNQPVVNGERVQPADRQWGEGTLDEMCLGVFYVSLQ